MSHLTAVFLLAAGAVLQLHAGKPSASKPGIKKELVGSVPVWVKDDSVDDESTDWIFTLDVNSGRSKVKDFAQEARGNGMRSKFEGHPGKGRGLSVGVIQGSRKKLTGTIRSAVAKGLEIRAVEQNSQILLQEEVSSWGLDRIDNIKGLDQSFDTGGINGSEVHVFVFDTGIRANHSEFEGRAIPTLELVTFPGTYCDPENLSCAFDMNGHGTHCAGTIGGVSRGVARSAILHAVKVLGDDGSGSLAGLVAAMDVIAAYAQVIDEDFGRPSLVSLSLGLEDVSPALDEAVRRLVASNVTVVVAAGNENTNACEMSPSRVAEAITVGATDAGDNRAWFSNYGACVDIFAPGVNISSAGINSDTEYVIKSGTSMATPHVSGAVALLLHQRPDLKPWDVAAYINKTSSKDVLQEDKRSLGPGSPNKLLYLADVATLASWMPEPTTTQTTTAKPTTTKPITAKSTTTDVVQTSITTSTLTASSARGMDAISSGSRLAALYSTTLLWALAKSKLD